jgi:hypothetical protein
MIVVHELAHLKEKAQQSLLSAVLPYGAAVPSAGVRYPPVADAPFVKSFCVVALVLS